jgi:hypothetical protein
MLCIKVGDNVNREGEFLNKLNFFQWVFLLKNTFFLSEIIVMALQSPVVQIGIVI